MPTHYPLEYDVEVDLAENAPFEIRAAHRPALLAGSSPEFAGSDTWWSPKHLLVSAVASSFAATFLALTKEVGVPLGTFRCRAKGFLDRTGGGIAFTSVHLTVDVRVVSDQVALARRLVDEARRRCFVTNSLRCPVSVSVEVHAS